MKRVSSYWVEDGDVELRRAVYRYGLRPLARSIGLTASMISRWLKGHNGMGEKNFQNLCKTVGVKIKEN